MKRFIIILISLLAFIFSLPVYAQSGNLLEMEMVQPADNVGETVIVRVTGYSDQTIQGYSFQIRYDSECLEPGEVTGMIPNMSSFPLPQVDGMVDVTYFGSQAQTVNGPLVEIQFTLVAICETSLMLENPMLTALDENGMSQSIEVEQGVSELSITANEFGTETKTATPTSTPTPVYTPEATETTQPISSLVPTQTAVVTETTSQGGEFLDVDWLAVLITLAIGMMAVLAGLMILLLRRSVPNGLGVIPMGGVPNLLVEHGPEAGEAFPLTKFPCRIGRGNSNDISLFSRNVSRQHAQIFSSHGVYYLSDLGSKNGTFLNGRRIRTQSVILHSGDRLKFGRDVQVIFRMQKDMDLTM